MLLSLAPGHTYYYVLRTLVTRGDYHVKKYRLHSANDKQPYRLHGPSLCL